MAVALDSSAIVGFLDRGDAFHASADRRIREALEADQNLCASVVSLAELLTGAKLGHHDESIVRGFFDDLVSEILPVDRAVAERAAELRASQRSLRMPDALILASADLHPDVGLLVCADRIAATVAGLDCAVAPLSAYRQ